MRSVVTVELSEDPGQIRKKSIRARLIPLLRAAYLCVPLIRGFHRLPVTEERTAADDIHC